MKKIVVLLTLLSCAYVTNAYRLSNPAFCFIGGLGSTYGHLGNIPSTVRATYPTIPFVELKIGNGMPAATKVGIYLQLEQLYTFASNEPSLKDKNVILIGGSQGGLLAESFTKMYRDKLPFKIVALMTLASPLAGQYGLPGDWENIVDTAVKDGGNKFPQDIVSSFGIKDLPIAIQGNRLISISEAIDPTRSLISKKVVDDISNIIKILIRSDMSLMRFIFYNPIGLKLISIAGYWHDPVHVEEYLKLNGFLPLMNNEILHPDAARYKANISALNRIIFFWAGKDETVTPACSGSKRFYKKGSTTEVEGSFTETDQYQKDLLGFKTMYDNGRLIIEYLPNDNHSCGSQEAVEKALRHINAILEEHA